jgi:hypothetical protein
MKHRASTKHHSLHATLAIDGYPAVAKFMPAHRGITPTMAKRLATSCAADPFQHGAQRPRVAA